MQWIVAISRGDLMEQTLENERVCSHHFVSCWSTEDFDKFIVDWLPALNLGTSKRVNKDSRKADEDWAEQSKARRKNLNETKVDIEEEQLRLNDEGTQACNISFIPLSDDQDLSTEETWCVVRWSKPCWKWEKLSGRSQKMCIETFTA